VIGAFDDEITGGTTDETLVGDSTSVAIANDAGDDLIKGSRRNDTLFGDNVDFFTTSTFRAAGGEDTLRGATGHGTLRAGPGDDAWTVVRTPMTVTAKPEATRSPSARL
jgi:Ca2+-binding RTX toxin-like protein